VGRRLFVRGWLDDWGDESVATTRHRLDEPRCIRRVSERIAQPANGGIQAVFKVDECFRRPQSLPQLLPCDELAGTLEQRLENLKRLIGQVDPDAALPQLTRAQVQLERAEADQSIQSSAHCRSLVR